MLVCFSHCCRAILSHRHTPSSLPTAELSGQDALQEELHWKSKWFKIHTLSYVSTAFPGPRSAILPHRNFTDMPLHTYNTHCSEFIQSNLHYCHRAATLWPGKFRLLHVKKSPIVYPKPRITSVPTGSQAEPSVILGYPNGIWHQKMRFYNQVKIKGQECLEASITHNFTLWCLQKSVLGTMLSAIH